MKPRRGGSRRLSPRQSTWSPATTYIASYHTDDGFYAATNNGFTSGVDNAPLHALSNAVAPNNGVYVYGSGGVVPAQTYQASNYWVDVVYSQSAGQDTTPPTITAVTPAPGATGVPTSITVTAAFSEAMNPATITTSTVTLRNTSTGAGIGATVNYSGGDRDVVAHRAARQHNELYGNGERRRRPVSKDAAGNPLAADYSWAFISGGAAVSPGEGAGGAHPGRGRGGEPVQPLLVRNPPCGGSQRVRRV